MDFSLFCIRGQILGGTFSLFSYSLLFDSSYRLQDFGTQVRLFSKDLTCNLFSLYPVNCKKWQGNISFSFSVFVPLSKSQTNIEANNHMFFFSHRQPQFDISAPTVQPLHHNSCLIKLVHDQILRVPCHFFSGQM